MSEFDPTVEYRDIQGWPRYKVGDDGSVWSRKKTGWIRLLAHRSKQGHLRVTLCRGGVQSARLVHHLVLEAFVGPRPSGMEGCHFPDRDPANNSLANLRWDTHASNLLDMEIHGTRFRGIKHGRAKLTAEQVSDIRIKYASGWASCGSIGSEYGVCEGTIERIVNGRAYKNEPGPTTKRKSRTASKFTPKQVESIRIAYAKGETSKSIADRHVVCRQTIQTLVSGKRYGGDGGPVTKRRIFSC